MANSRLQNVCQVLDTFITVELNISLTYARIALQSAKAPAKRARNREAAHRGYDTALRMLQSAKAGCPGFQLNRPEAFEQLRVRLLELEEPLTNEGDKLALDSLSFRGLAFQTQSRTRWIQGKVMHASTYILLASAKLANGKTADAVVALHNARLTISSARTLLDRSSHLGTEWLAEARGQLDYIEREVSRTERRVRGRLNQRSRKTGRR